MSKLVWDQIGERFYETGVDRGVLYPYDTSSNEYAKGVAWNGLTSVQENATGGEPSPIYADNIEYLNLRSAEEFGATIEAYTYPDEFAVLDGTAELAANSGVYIGQQKRGMFGFCYRTKIGNDTDGDDLGYKLHIVYGAVANPSQRQYDTINSDPNAVQFSWEITTTPISVEGFRPTSTIIIDSTKIDSAKLALIEAKLYGTDAGDGVQATDPELLMPDEILDLID